MIKFGVIGTGWIAEEFVKGAVLVEGLEFAAVYSRNKETGTAFAEPFGGAEIFDDIEAFAKSDIDAVYIASPNSLHYSQSKLMLENGKHVLCEKPITVTPAEFKELWELADSKNLIYTEAIMYLHLPARKILLEKIKDLGIITTAHFDFSQLSSKYEAFKNGTLPNIFNPKFATGCLMDLGIYCYYPALEIFGEPEKITAEAMFLSSKADGWGSAILTYPNAQVTLTYSKIGQDRCGSMICGDEGTIVLPSVSKLTEMCFYNNEGEKTVLSPDEEKHILMKYEAEDFLKYIQDPKSRKEYEYCNNLILKVNAMLETIRAKTDIIFG